MRRWVLLTIFIAFIAIDAAPACAGDVTVPMLGAIDDYGARYAQVQDWDYVDRLATTHGDYRRAYATLIFTTTYEGVADGREIDVPGEWEVDVRVVRCGPGWYVVSSPLDRQVCHPILRWAG